MEKGESSQYRSWTGQQELIGLSEKKRRTKASVVKSLLILSLIALLSLKIYLMIFVIDPVVGIYGFVSTALIFMAFFFSYTRYRDPATLQNTSNNISNGIFNRYEPLVSIIVPAKNEPMIIQKTVASFLESTYQNTEIILVNDGSTDETGAIMDQMHKMNPRKIKEVIHLDHNMGKRKALRQGISKVSPQSEIIIVVDSDSIVDKMAIEKLVPVFRDPDVGAATGHGRVMNADVNVLTKMQDTWYDGQFAIMKGMESSFNTVTCCPGIFSAYRKAAILPCIDRWCNDTFLGGEFRFGDDRHLTSYVLGGTKHYVDSNSRTWKVLYSSSAVVYSEAPTTLKKWVKQNIRWKKSWFRVFLFTAPFYYKDRSVIAAIFYYLQMTLSLITPIIGFRAIFLLPTLGRPIDSILYISGLLFVGMLYAVEFKLRNPDSGNRFFYRMLMTLVSSFIFTFLLYYSMLTIKKQSWLTR